LPVIWLTRLNSLFIGLVDWPYRPENGEGYVSLQAFQEQFDSYFSQFVSEDELRKININECELFETLAGVWKMFAMEVYRPQKNIKRSMQNELRNNKIAINKSIQNEFKKNKLALTLQTTGQNHYLLIDIEDPIVLFDVLVRSYHIIKKSIKPADFPSIKHLVLQTTFPNFTLVFTFKRRAFFKQAYSLPLYRLISEESNEIGPMDILACSIPQNVKFDLDAWPSIIPEITDAEKLMTNISDLYYFVLHLLKLKELGEILTDDDHAGIDVFKDHFKKYSEILQDRLQAAIDAIVILLNCLSELLKQAKIDQSDFNELFHGLKLIHSDLVYEKSSNDKIYMEMSLEKMNEWSQKLRNARDTSVGLFVFGAAYLLNGNRRIRAGMASRSGRSEVKIEKYRLKESELAFGIAS
jgi:hypothetical protein